jgi:type IX secretion system PorP/SprF family membrane protein
MGKFYILLACLIFIGKLSFGQDIHFTQFYYSPITLNPALTGDIEDGNLRYAANYRNQWYTITSPYVTTSFSVDAKLMEERLHDDALGLGIILINDRSGAAALNNLQLQISTSYRKYFDAKKVHLASLGLQAGFFQKKIDMNKLNFGSQYQDGNFDNTLSSGEGFTDLKKSNLDFNAGLVYSYSPQKKLQNIKGGLCIYHINTPNESLSGNIDKLSMRSSFFAEARVQLQEDFFLCPKLLQMNQQEAAETNVSIVVEKKMQNMEEKKTSLLVGTGVRISDAYIFMAGMKYNNWLFALSYDVNSSELNRVTNSQGAIEFSLIYRDLIIPGKNKLPRVEPCPRM